MSPFSLLRLPWWLSSKESACNAGDLGLIPAEGNGYPLQYFAWRIPWTEMLGGLQSMGSKSQTLPLAPQSALFLRLPLSLLMALVCTL